MDTNMQNTPKITKESKNKIRVEFDRTPLKERLKAKFLNLYFFQQVAWIIFRMVLLVGISYVVLFPFISKIAGSFMSPEDFVDVTVRLIPKNFTLDIYKAVLFELDYWEAFFNTLLISLLCGLLQTFVCCLIGYGLAKFRFKGNSIVMLLVILTMIVPHQTVQLSLYMAFRYFDILGIFQFLGGGGIPLFGKTFLQGVIDLAPETSKIWSATGLNLVNTYWPLIILSLVGLAFKNGLYIFYFRQFFRGLPKELEDAAYLDGCGPFKTFLKVMVPNASSSFLTVFLFSIVWYWNDYYVSATFFTDTRTISLMLRSLDTELKRKLFGTISAEISPREQIVWKEAGCLISITPLLIVYVFLQKHFIEGIERSGIVG